MGFQSISAGLLLASFTALSSAPGLAQTTEQQTPPTAPATSPAPKTGAAAYAGKVHLAYIRTTSTTTDALSRRGLEALAATLQEKTSVEPQGVVSLDIERDDISFFPVLYWTVSEQATPLSIKARDKVQKYLNTGGMIIFDIKNTSEPLGSRKSLERMLNGVSLNHLAPLDKDHVLHQTYYRLPQLRGSFNYNTVMVESPSTKGNNAVSSVIIGENNWAGAWAGVTLPQSSQEREMAMRAGINMVMYALTGNYKTDQAQIMKTIDRLDKK